MTTDHRAQVDELLADYRRSRDRLATVQRDLATIVETATSPDGSVRATVGAQGTLTDLELDDHAYRMPPRQLAQVVLRTVQEAAGRAAERTFRTLGTVLPAATDPEALVHGRADLRPEEIAPPAPVRSRRDDDEDFEQRDWLNVEAAPAPRRTR
ncbi:YbaB/EbfC family nucleoid-associated protein [Saccharothrix violaceirubra]|uniref:DNA-binding protein YbaB n=1 Tax=Saccharothrix violaceirubra TaxID=413306 RepID=A0A7W7WTH8_9PSEU|nr:YbaB/EbfC family nucleoid-associated protein [Saccharothrix violaceirubra]MBB4963124.1 DNA-binding protein YbaB [Saccharothrix violaceirubra]